MSSLRGIITRLLDDAQDQSRHPEKQSRRHLQIREHLDHLEDSDQRRLVQQLLCVRHAEPSLPGTLLDEIDSTILAWRSQRLLTPARSIPPALTFARSDSLDQGSVSVWQGDITTVSGATAITNAANSAGLGCFQPSHRCIDNAIHAWAGPRLRDDCHRLMTARGRELDPGECVVTPGRCLPAAHVVHVLGPQLAGPGAVPEPGHNEQLAQCYRSVLDAVEALPPGDDGRKRVVFCGISTGLFAFPARQAAELAVRSVAAWLQSHQRTTVTDIIFNTFTDADTAIYTDFEPCAASRGGG
ncbi:hypothetical protein CDD83_7426 [Cordyceps sp. RAO-2017]|nr:hypothetical protein CDD83_7426 [Cordyceps sp. RAO-2017]